MAYPLCRNDHRLCRALADKKIAQATGYDPIKRCPYCHRVGCKDAHCDSNHRKPYAGSITCGGYCQKCKAAKAPPPIPQVRDASIWETKINGLDERFGSAEFWAPRPMGVFKW